MNLTESKRTWICNAHAVGIPSYRIAQVLNVPFPELMSAIAADDQLSRRVHEAQKAYAESRRTRLKDHEIDSTAEQHARELTFTD